MDEFDFSENEMSTPIETLRKKKTELDDEKPYNVIRNTLYNELNEPSVQKSYVQVNKQDPIKKHKKNKHKMKTYNYQNLFIFVIIFFLVNIYELNIYLSQQKLSYYTIVFIKLLLFILMYYISKCIL